MTQFQTEQDPHTQLHVPKGAMTGRERTWQCKRGHSRTSEHPFVLDMFVHGEQVMRTSALCPTCFKTWLEQRFGADLVVAAGATGPNRDMRRSVKVKRTSTSQKPG